MAVFCHRDSHRLWWYCFYECLCQLFKAAFKESTTKLWGGSKPLTHHCTLYFLVKWPSLYICRLLHWYTFIYKSFQAWLNHIYLVTWQLHHSRHSQTFITYSFSWVRTEQGKKVVSLSGPSSWSTLLQDQKLSNLMTLEKLKLKELVIASRNTLLLLFLFFFSFVGIFMSV